MLYSRNRILVICALFMATGCFTGCDQISSAIDRIKGPDKDVAAVPSLPPKAKKAASAPIKKDTLAVVGNWSITVEEFNDRLLALKEIIPEYDTNDPQAKQLVLDELVNQQVLVAGAERSGLANQKDIHAAVDEFRRTLIVREVARKLTENITVSEEEAMKFYNDNQDILIGSAEWKVREIVVPTKEKATGILAQILSGADFAALARQSSTSPTAANGGDLGYIIEEPFPQMGNALLSLEVGDTSGVFKGPEGYYIVKLEDKKEGTKIGFEEIKADIIESQTMLKQQEAILNHLDRLKANTKIEINNDLL